MKGADLACPFRLGFDGDGRSVHPLANARTPKPTAHVSRRQRNGLVMAWYHPDEAVEPQWEIPELPEFNGDPEFSEPVTRHYTIHAAWQELAENGADPAHFRYVHNTEVVPEVEEYQTDGVHAQMRSSQKFPTPRGVVEGRIDVDNWGPGFSFTWFRGIVDTLLLGCNTPIDEDTLTAFHLLRAQDR